MRVSGSAAWRTGEGVGMCQDWRRCSHSSWDWAGMCGEGIAMP